MKTTLCTSMLFLLLIFNSKIDNVYAQQKSLVHYNIENGLPSNTIFQLYKDSNGFLWICSENGLVRFNGQTFYTFKTNTQIGNSFSQVKEDKFHQIWASTFNGQILYAKEDSLLALNQYDNLKNTGFPCIEITNNHQLLIANRTNKISIANIHNTSTNSIKIHTINCNATYYNFLQLYDNTLLSSIIFPNKIRSLQIVKNTNNFKDSLLITSKNYFIHNNNLYLKKTALMCQGEPLNEAQILIYSHKKFNEISLSYNKEKFIQNPLTQSICLTNNNNLFIGTNKGLFLFETKGINNEYEFKEKILEKENISAIEQDNFGNIWIATLNNGIYKYSNNNLYNLFLSQNTATTHNISHLASDEQNTIVFSCENQKIYEYNVSNCKTRECYLPKGYNIQRIIYDKYTKSFLVHQQATYAINRNPKELKALLTLKGLSNIKKAYYINSDSILAVWGHLSLIVKKENKLVITDLLKLRCYSFEYDSLKKITWVASNQGLFYLNKQFVPQKILTPNKQNIYAKQVKLCNNILVVSTFNNGVFFIKDGKVTEHINTNNGLLSNSIEKIAVNENYIAILNNHTVQIFNFITKEVQEILSSNNGLISKGITDLAFVKNTLYLSTNKGLQYLVVNKNTSSFSNIKPYLSVQSIKINNTKLTTTLTDTVLLKPNAKHIQIQLVGSYMNTAHALYFQYNLSNNANSTPNKWTEINNYIDPQITLENLTPGNYWLTYKLIADKTNTKAEITKQLLIIIQKPWYKEWYSITLLGIIILVIGVFIYQLKIKQINKKHFEENAKIALQHNAKMAQLTSIKAQMNPHFIFNALNSIQDFILLNEKENANYYLGKFSDLMRNVLDMSSREVVNLEEETTLLNNYLNLEALRLMDDFIYTIKHDERKISNLSSIKIPPLLIQPYVENAIKHGLLHKKNEKKLSIEFTTEDNNILVCNIEDNGIGRKLSKEINAKQNKMHTSFATGATENRLKLINSINNNIVSVSFVDKYENNKAAGTLVILKIHFTP